MSNLRNPKSSVPNDCKTRKITQSLLQIRLCVEIVKYLKMFTNTTLARTLSPLRLLRIFALAAATMLLAVLLHLLIFHLLTASDVPAPTPAPNAIAPPRKDTQYKIKHVETCPKVGFFFKREGSANSLFPDACYLCFCQGDHTAVCWKRDNRRCNEESFQYHAVGKRQKRSPGFTDLFFRDASRDFFNKNTKTQCKPYESSFSDDCPPADWCVGCTVCDCDSNGHWDCHLLSFCPEGKKNTGKNKNKKQPEVPDEWLQFVKKTKEKTHRGAKSSKKAKLKPKPKPKPKPKSYKIPKPNIKGKPVQRGGKKPTPPKRIVKKNVPLKAGRMQHPGKMKTPIKYRKIAHNKPNSSKMIKKNIATHKPIQIKTKPNKNKKNLEAELAHSMMKKIMQNLRKHVSAKMKNMSETVKQSSAEVKSQKAKAKVNQTINKPKTIKKRQVKKTNPKPPLKKVREPMKKPVYEAKGKTTKKPGTYVRNKREVPMSSNTGISTDAIQDNFAQSTIATMPLNVIPVTSDPYVLDSNIDNFIYPLGASATLPDKAYYKYTIGNEESRSPISNIDELIPETATTYFNKTETAFNLISPQLAPNVPTTKRQVQDTEVNQRINLKEINPEENELKYSKWYNVKILKEKTLFADSDIKHKSLFKLMPPTNKTIVLENKIRNHGNKGERMLSYNKSNGVKFLNRSKCKLENCKINNSIDIHTNHQPTSIKTDLRGYLKKFFNYHPKNKTSYHPMRRRKLNVLKYLKGIFNKIFKGNKTPVRMNRRQLIDTLCENFGPCLKMTKKDKVLLNTKIAELHRETGKILKTVKIIKGLLRLLEVPNINNSGISKQEHVRNDLQTLSNVLKGRYDNVNFTLSSTQKTQIQYIKRCTQDFMQSVTKFASLLNAIISILTTDGNNRLRSKGNNYFVNKDLSQDDPFQSLKNLLLRYNLIQNTFMKQMYEQVNSFENKINVKPKVSEVKDFNNSVAIENISRNIIHHLRKLKRLSQTASYRGRGMGRTKRNIAREDDAIEYLLMMMEYLMKQNHPLDAEPVNDGIDLLIDAIKNAPDIKPIKKKVLENTPAVISYVTSTSTESPKLPLSTAVAEESQSEDDSPSESDKTSSEDVVKGKPKANARKLNVNKNFANILDDEKELEDKLQFDRKVEPDKADEITEMSFFSKFEKEDKIIEESESVYQTTITTTIVPLETETNDKLETRNDVNVDKIPVVETSSSEKPVDDTEQIAKKIEVFTGDTDDETILPITVTTESDSPTILITEHRTRRLETQKSKLKMKNLQTYDNDNDDKRSKLKWIEENFGKESEKGYVDLGENNSTLDKPPVTAETKTKDAKTLDKIDVTGGTKEKGEIRARNGEIEKYDVTEKKKTTSKLSTEEIMFRKQMELLNSLDYGTERAEVFEADVKDSNVDERYSGDSFPSYFV